jgi:hypothetical protein
VEADIQEVLISYAAELIEDDLEWLTVLSVPDNKVDSDTVVEKPFFVCLCTFERCPNGG